MTNVNLNYPVFIFKENDNILYATNEKLGFFSKGGGKFFKGKVLVIDSKGYSYYLSKSSVKGSASFWVSTKYLQPMYEMNLEFETKPQIISLEDLKIKAMNQVKLKPKFWRSLDTIKGIQERVDKSRTYRELILIFK